MHHSLIHAMHTRHPSSSAVVRLASRWIASHMLSDMIPHEAIELIVAKIYTEVNDNTHLKLYPIDAPPSTVMSGFLMFLRLLFSHDWAKAPLVVDPQMHISSRDRSLIYSQFDAIRGPEHNKGPPMYIISPADYDGVEEMIGSKVGGFDEDASQAQSDINSPKTWAPSITATHPERVVLSRASALAKCSHDHLISCMMRGDSNKKWAAAFEESSASLTSYSALLRVDVNFIIDSGCSSTEADCAIRSVLKTSEQNLLVQSPYERSMQKRCDGPKELRKKHYKNLVLQKDTLVRLELQLTHSSHSELNRHLFTINCQLEWNPVKQLVAALRNKYHRYAVFFYNEYCPDIIAMLWRPTAFVPESFSAMVSEFKHPVISSWKEDTLVTANAEDLIYELCYMSKDIVTNIKILDDKKQKDADEPAVKRQKSNTNK